jgi:hypothetical protein
MSTPTELKQVTRNELGMGQFYFVLTTSLFGTYAMWTGAKWLYLVDDVEHIMAFGPDQLIYEAPQPQP